MYPKLGEPPEYYLILFLGDLLVLTLSFFLALFTRNLLGQVFKTIPFYSLSQGLSLITSYWWLFIPIPLTFIYHRLYDRRLCFWEETRELLRALILAFLGIFALIFVKKLGPQISRLNFGFMFVYAIFLLPAGRYLLKIFLFKFSRYHRKALIIGASEGVECLIRALEKDKFLGYEVIGLLDDNPILKGKIIEGKKVFGSLRQLNKFISFLNVDTIFLNSASFENGKLAKILASIQNMVKEICILPDFKTFGMLNTETQTLFNEKLFLLKTRNNLKSPTNILLKKVMDYTFSLLLLPVLLPVMGIIAIFIKLDSPGPIFFVHERIGRFGKRIRVYKFRTMYQNADQLLEEYLAKNPEARKEWVLYKKLKCFDPRVTRMGKFLRKTSLDELPQIFNVLKGEMSLVGPRPYLPREETEMNSYQHIILLTNPGITGLWQVSGRNNLTFRDRIKTDTWYVLNWSLWLDLIILLKTIIVVLKKEGAH
ncbi:hypothetical protein TH606_08310 [Thermodesulfatator autotrophicus]|uniref:Bacterial sugar transferase domain-containing protein n=1 Tax=Thermodesulfatator autotrophicus TaxID=1795632 RepID=A0A177E5F7_9BACT|nr:hypothetical protein TH606_08310 [Thermodesulfatator autotrophicus]